MALNQVRISFYVDVEAESYGEVEVAVNNLLDQLGEVETELSWEDVDWQLTRAPEQLIPKPSN